MTSGLQPPSSGAPVPVQGVTGGPPVLGGQISNDPQTGNVVVAPNPGQVLQIRKGSNPTALQVYEYFHTNTDYSRLAFNTQTGGPFQIQVETQPPTVIRALNIAANGNIQITAGGAFVFGSNGTNQWQIPTSGNFLAVTDNTYDIGQASFGRPRNLYIASNLFVAGQISITGPVNWTSGQGIGASGTLLNINGGTGGTIVFQTQVQFGNTFTLSATAGAATALPTAPALYFTVMDQGGVQRKIPAYNP